MSHSCKRCAGWRPSPDPMDYGWGTCARVSMPDRPTQAKFSVIVVDGLLETAQLITHEDYGCVEFTPRLKRVMHSDIVYEETNG